MKTIKLSLEYGAWPLWLIDENNQVIDTTMPEEWKGQEELESILDELQQLYESQWINNEKAFEYKGFLDKDKETRFTTLLNIARNRIITIIPKGWQFVDGTLQRDH